jgi:hypothetical protein
MENKVMEMAIANSKLDDLTVPLRASALAQGRPPTPSSRPPAPALPSPTATPPLAAQAPPWAPPMFIDLVDNDEDN